MTALALDAGVELATRQGRVTLTRRGVPVEHQLTVEDALALTLLSAHGDAGAAAEALSALLDDTVGADRVEQAIHRYWPFLRERPDGEATSADLEWLRGLSRSPSSYVPPPRRAAAPQAVTWLTTLGCNRRCTYCFYDVFPYGDDRAEDPPDATLPTERAIAMVREMGALGAADLYLTGGEPLLRRDVIDVIAEATAARVRTHLVTKFAITAPLARRLAGAGTTHVTISLDDARPRQAAMLAGARDYLREATAAIEALLAEDLRVDVNCVVTHVNEPALDALAARLVELGIRRLTLGALGAPAAPRKTLLRLWPEADVDTHIDRLRAAHGDRLAIERSGSGARDGSDRECGGDLVCDVGMTALDVLPDGTVTRCRYLPGRTEIHAGSVRDASLLEIWNGAALADLVRPPVDRYAGTPCASCAGFEPCHDRGRCYFTAHAASAQLFAPDAFCRR